MTPTANAKGALFMAIAMAGFTCNDALVKSVTGAMNTGQILFVRGLMTTVLVVAIARWMGALGSWRIVLQPAVALRMTAEIIASLAYVSALGAMPLANTASILQALPLAVTLGAALFLNEKVGWRRWLAIIAGFAGVLIVIRPGPEGFSLAAVYVIASVVGAAARDLCTRRIDRAVPSLFISVITAVSITVTGAVMIVPMGGWQPVSGEAFVRLAAASVLLLVGYQTIVIAMRTGEISFIAPFRYTSLIWAIAIGFLFFGEVPDFWMTVGVMIIVASGLYTFSRENRRQVAEAVAQESKPESP
ncbi:MULTISPECIES: DMT family transporter [unclassified Shinella]|uniref:DMT family transporter n=1 Tax=unclassified Shinella TaxID=2643062 RepID=UPI00225D8CA3|nr:MULTISPECIES: DMT family transporter [unclassified Shinella]MCO5138416.1 DMT family transporter [Shinella sp.]MDC7255253.1 DMT family transporter [Shinella sp. YE25]CAI0338020.1 Drug/metabolite transporter (DMT)-like permease [Rhizobiaceae bacterium]CAK7256485.1 S-adenosylmethionine uptake transporter [Shinella sp. WSC3-e]